MASYPAPGTFSVSLLSTGNQTDQATSDPCRGIRTSCLLAFCATVLAVICLPSAEIKVCTTTTVWHHGPLQDQVSILPKLVRSIRVTSTSIRTPITKTLVSESCRIYMVFLCTQLCSLRLRTQPGTLNRILLHKGCHIIGFFSTLYSYPRPTERLLLTPRLVTQVPQS